MYKYLRGGSKEHGARLFSEVCTDRTRGNGHKPTYRMFHLSVRKIFFYFEGSQVLEEVPRELHNLHPWVYSKPSLTWP